MSKNNYLLLLLLGLAFGLRLVSLNQSLWLDEAIQWWASSTFDLGHLLTRYIRGDFNPPLFHLLLHFWIGFFGSTEAVLRLPSVIFGTLTVFFSYRLARLLLPAAIPIFKWRLTFAAAAALLTATSGLLIYYSQEARMYSLTGAVATAGLYYLLKLKLDHPRRPAAAISYCLAVVSMLYSHYFTWFLLPFLVVSEPLLTLLGLLGILPWLPIFARQLTQGLATAGANPIWAQTVGALSVKNIALVPVKFLIGRISLDNNLFYGLALVLPLVVSLSLLLKSALSAARNKSFRLLWLWFISPFVLAFLVAVKVPLFSYFRFVFLLPVFYLLLLHGLSRLSPRRQMIGVCFLLAVNCLSASLYLLNPQFHRENWRAATAYIRRTDPVSPVIVHAAVRSPFEYYNQGQPALLYPDDNLLQLTTSAAVWYVAYAQPIFDPQGTVREQLLELGFHNDLVKIFRGVRLEHYLNNSVRYYSVR